MSDQPSKIIPNTFQCPNALVDASIMSVLTGNETKCYMVVVRKTFGWHKSADRISKSQIMDATGLGETAVDNCMNSLVLYGLVVRAAENDPNTNQGILWALQTDDAKIGWAALCDRSTESEKKHAARMVHLRSRRGVGLAGNPRSGGQGGGGVGGQGTQKPLSKTNLVINGAGDVFSAYEANVGIMTPVIADAINVWLDVELVPAVWIVEAIVVATKNNARNWAYIEAILKNWKANGKDAKKLSGGTNGKSKSGNGGQGGATPVQPTPTDADRAAAERVKARRNGSLS